MREVFQALERLGIAWFVTGSEAAACYGSMRQTFDVDIVVDLSADRFPSLAGEFPDHAVSEPIRYEGFAMASVISSDTAAKADLIMRDGSAWSGLAMERRVRCAHADYGEIWVSSLEDLIVAKLKWSEGTSELQLRDCGQLIRINKDEIDWPYLEHAALSSGVQKLLLEVRDAR